MTWLIFCHPEMLRFDSAHSNRFFMAKKNLFDAYFRFLLAQAVQTLPSVPKLDAAEERLLAALTASWHAGPYTHGHRDDVAVRRGRSGYRASQADEP